MKHKSGKFKKKIYFITSGGTVKSHSENSLRNKNKNIKK